MLYMAIERFKDAPEIYRRFREKGRMMPDGLEYVSSWIDVDLTICWQLMRTDDFALFQLDRQLERLDGFRNRSGPHFGRSQRAMKPS